MEKAHEWDKNELVRLLENDPMYTSIEFFGKRIPDFNTLEVTVSELSFYCPQCKTVRLFHIHNKSCRPFYGNPSDDFLCFSLFCSKESCRLNKRIYLHYTFESLVEDDDTVIEHVKLTKCGEYPSLSPRVDEVILNVFPNDADLLQKAVCCLKEGFGVGAYAYLRQVLEAHIILLISEIERNAKEQGDIQTQQKLAELRNDAPMKKKIKIANEALPPYLRIGGQNPLGLLYQTLSEGIHALSDKDCLEKANAIYSALTFILNTLAVSSANRKSFEASLKKLNRSER